MLTFPDIISARDRLALFVPVTPLRTYASLDQAVGSGITVFVKHENHLPTNSFNALDVQCADLADVVLDADAFDLVHAALVLESSGHAKPIRQAAVAGVAVSFCRTGGTG